MKRQILLLLLLLPMTALAQVAVFGSFGTQNDTVTALYNNQNDGKLYIGAKIVNGSTAKYYEQNGGIVSLNMHQNVNTIRAIGQIPGGVVYAHNYYETNFSSQNGNMISYYTGTWSAPISPNTILNSNNVYILDATDYGNATIFSGNGTPFITDGTNINLSTSGSAIRGLTVFGTNFVASNSMHNISRYFSSTNSWAQIYSVNAGVITDMLTFNGKLYIVGRSTSDGINYTDKLYSYDGVTLSQSILTSPSYQLTAGTTFSRFEGYLFKLCIHDNKLFIGGKVLYSMDASENLTQELSEIPNGQIIAMESYGNKLAIGGSFQDLNGDASLDNLAYLEYVSPPVAQFSQDDATGICAGSFQTFTVNATNADTYTWSFPGSNTPTFVGQEPGLITYNTAGTYAVTLTVQNAAGTDTYTENITVHANPAPSISADDLSLCDGEQATLTADGSWSNIEWSNGSFGQAIQTGITGDYFATVTDLNGCMGNSQLLNVAVFDNPAPVISGDESYCEGGSVVLYATGLYDSYQWTGGPATSEYEVTAGTYTVTVSQNGCYGTSEPFVVTENALPVPVPTYTGGVLSSNYATGNQWNFGGNVVSTDESLMPAQNGTYTLTVTSNGCSASADIQVGGVGLTEAEIASYLQFDGSVAIITIDWTMYDITGKVISTGVAGSSVEIPGGLYFISTDKFIKKIQR